MHHFYVRKKQFLAFDGRHLEARHLNLQHFVLNDSQNYEHDKQCAYNVTSRRLRVTIVAVEKQ